MTLQCIHWLYIRFTLPSHCLYIGM